MKIRINKNTIFTFLFFTLFLDAYCFFSVGNRSFTLWYVGALLLFAFPKEIIAGMKKNPYVVVMIIYMIINYAVLGDGGLGSFAIGIFCWIFYLFSYRTSSVVQFRKTVSFFQNGMKIMAVYGIYQVLAYRFDLPFANLWMDGIMVDGYNWGNDITIGSLVLRRANAIFREPSYFSQFLAISMLIYIYDFIVRNGVGESKRNIKWIVIEGVALILSFSGTGLLILGVGLILLLLTSRKYELLTFLRKYGGWIFLAVVLVLVSLFLIRNPLVSYFLSRTQEFDSSNAESVSGYLRFVLPYQVVFEVIQYHNAFLGLGIGNVSDYVLKSGRAVENSVQPILPRTLAEEGIVGGLILFGFVKRIWRKENFFVPEYKAILIGTLVMSFTHGTWSSEVFWLLLGFLNVDFIKEKNWCLSENKGVNI